MTEEPKTEREARIAGKIVDINEDEIRGHLDEMVRNSVEDTLNALLDAEADRLCGAKRYEHSADRKDTRAGSYKRKLHQGRRGRDQDARSGCHASSWDQDARIRRIRMPCKQLTRRHRFAKITA